MQSASLSSLNRPSNMLRAISKLPRARLASRSGLRNATTAARRAQEGERAAQDQTDLQTQQPQRGGSPARYAPSNVLSSPFSLTRDFAPLLPSRVSSIFRCALLTSVCMYMLHHTQIVTVCVRNQSITFCRRRIGLYVLLLLTGIWNRSWSL